jgi:hypothetical protein
VRGPDRGEISWKLTTSAEAIHQLPDPLQNLHRLRAPPLVLLVDQPLPILLVERKDVRRMVGRSLGGYLHAE